MPYIGNEPKEFSIFQPSKDVFTGDGSTTNFDLTNVVPGDNGEFDVQVFVENVRQEPGSTKSYTIDVNNNNELKRITFNTAPSSGEEIYVINPGKKTSLAYPVKSINIVDNSLSSMPIELGEDLKIIGSNGLSSSIDDNTNTVTITTSNIPNSSLINSSITITDDTSTTTSINLGETLKIIGGTGIDTSLTGDNITITRSALSYSSASFIGDDSTTAFTINSGRSVEDILVSVGGSLLDPSNDYTVVGTTLTITGSAPTNGTQISVRYLPL
jgi:hypothetical protein